MPFREILVHLDGNGRDDVRTAAAVEIARRFDARLTGLFARVDRDAPSVVARRPSRSLAAAADAAETAFAKATEGSGLVTRCWRLPHGEPGHVLSETIVCSRFADLVVLGQHADGDALPSDFVEQVTLHAGHPCLVIPAKGTCPTIATNVLVAWNGGREAARALHDAMPLIETAAAVEVVTIRAPGAAATCPDMPPVRIHDYLAAHGVASARESLVGEGISPMDLILSRCFDLGADLLVMGAHGGYHLPFFRGTATRHILRYMTIPVLMAH